jgi:ubiquinone/menaquinone biosynthesis C-methylase UbiE
MKSNLPDETLARNINLYDSYYKKPDWWFQFRYDTQVKRKTCLHLLHSVGQNLSDKCILEIGFGSGSVLFSFNKSCEIYGLEISRSAIEHAERKALKGGYKKYEFQLISNETLPYPDGFFDIVIASHVVEHVGNDIKLLQEIKRTLKRDGHAVVLIPINENYNDPNHKHSYKSQDFIRLAESCSMIPVYQMENEFLFHFVEKFYFKEYNRRWKVFGAIISALFNFPTAILPFHFYQIVDKCMLALGWKPRQLGCVLVTAKNQEVQ